MKILEVIPDLRQRAGAEVFFESLVTEMATHPDLEIVVVTIWDLVDPSFSNFINDKRIKYYCCGKRKNGISLSAIRKFKKILKTENPDIVHTHRSVALTYFLSFGFKKNHWKYVHTVHNIANKEAGKYEIFLRKIYVKKGLIKQIGISDLVSKSILETYKHPVSKTIYNGIKLPNVSKTDKKYDFICVARFSKQKNHTLLLEAFKEFSNRHPDSKLLLVGSGELLDFCEDFCVTNSLTSNVIFYGSSPKAVELMNESRVLVLSSLYEGNPISILEAMSIGLPVIAPSVGGIPDVVEDEKNGLLFPVSDKNSMLCCMETLYSDHKKYEEISTNNLVKSQQFSIEKCADSYISFFKTL